MTRQKVRHQKGPDIPGRKELVRPLAPRRARFTLADGSKLVVRRQHCERLCEYSDRQYRATQGCCSPVCSMRNLNH